MENMSKANQQKQIQFLEELFMNSCFSSRWKIQYVTEKSWSNDFELSDERNLKVYARPENEEEKQKLTEIQEKMYQQAESNKEVYQQLLGTHIIQYLQIGQKLRHYTNVLNALDDSEGEIKHQEGEVMFLYFWSTSSEDSLNLMQSNYEMLNKNSEKWAGKVRTIALTFSEEKQEVVDLIQQKNWESIPHFVVDRWQNDRDIIKDYFVTIIPYVALVDKNGFIQYLGDASKIDIEQTINKLVDNLPESQELQSKETMNSEKYKLVKSLINGKLAEYFASQDVKQTDFYYKIKISKKTELQNGKKIKFYESPSIEAVFNKKQAQNYQTLKNYVSESLPNINLKYDQEKVFDVQEEIKKDMQALSNIYDRFNTRSIENKHCVQLSFELKKGSLVFRKQNYFNQHKKLFDQNMDIEQIESAADEQQQFIFSRFSEINQQANYLQKMLEKGIQISQTDPSKPKNSEDIYRKYKRILNNKTIKDLKIKFEVDYDINLKLYLKKRKVFDSKGQMIYKYYSQPVCKYDIREKDLQKFQTEVLDKIFAKFDKNEIIFRSNILKAAKIQEGKNCKLCNCDLSIPYYFNYFQKVHYCIDCGDKRDTTLKTLQQFAIPHNLILITTNDQDTLKDIDECKIGKDAQPNPDEDIEFCFSYFCNGCGGSNKDSRYVCLNCQPGPFKEEKGYADFCDECLKKQVFVKDESFIKQVQQNCIDHNSNHLYLKVITPVGEYKEY